MSPELAHRDILRLRAGLVAIGARADIGLVALAPDIILAMGTTSVGPLLRATPTVSIVFRASQRSGRCRLRRKPGAALELHFCILAHVYKGAKNSSPHDHGPSWAVYSQVTGVTEMTDWRLVEKPTNGRPGKVVKGRTYELTPGKAHVYNEGDVHSPRRESETRLIRIEGTDLTKVKRDKFEIAA
jgi:hypothetical protein